MNDKLSDAYMQDAASTPLLSREEEVELANRIRAGDEAAREKMICANLRLVIKIARDYSGYGLPIADLVAEGNTGLMKAVDRFDPTKGAKFSTYGAWWIKQSIRRALSNHSRTIRLPVHVVEKISLFRKESTKIEESKGRSPTSGELEKAMGVNRRQLRIIRESAAPMSSLDAEVFENDEITMHDRLEDEHTSDPFAQLCDANMLGELEVMLGVLNSRERKIVEARFGLVGASPQTLEKVGERFGVTRERIRQIQNQALCKMRAELRRRESPLPTTFHATPEHCTDVMVRQSSRNFGNRN